MKEVDRGVFTNLVNNYIVDIINNLHTFIADFEYGTLSIRILEDYAKVYANVVSKHGYRRAYDFEADRSIAQIFIDAYENDPNLRAYRYYVTYDETEAVTRVFQYDINEKSVPIVTLKDLNENRIVKNDQTIVVQQPVVSGPSIITPFKSEKFIATSKILSQEDTAITTFLVEFNKRQIPVYVMPNTADSRISFEIDLKPGEYKSGDVLELKVTAVDNELHYSSTCIKELVVDAGKIRTPNILNPYNNNYISHNNIYLEVSIFTLIKAVDPEQVSTDWKITTDRKGNNIIKSGTFAGAETRFILNFEEDLQDGTYFIFVRQEDIYIGYSDWSDPTKVVVDKDYKYEWVIPPYIQNVIWIDRGGTYTLPLESNSLIEDRLRALEPISEKSVDSGVYDEITAFKVIDNLNHINVTIPSSKVLSAQENYLDIPLQSAEYTFTVPQTARFYFADHFEYMISVKAIDINGKESLNNYAFVRVLSHTNLYERRITIMEETTYTLTDLIPAEFSNFRFEGNIHSHRFCETQVQGNKIIITPKGIPSIPAGFVYTLTSIDNPDLEAFISVIITIKRMPEKKAFFFDLDWEINSLMNDYTPPTLHDLYYDWDRFGNFDQYYLSTETPLHDASRWDYLDNRPVTTIDTGSPTGFVSKKYFMYYTLEVDVSSTDDDDDIMGVVLAYHHGANKNQMLIAARVGHTKMQPPLPLIENNFGILYLNGSEITILKTSRVKTGVISGHWNSQSPSRIYANRIKTKFTVMCSNFESVSYNEGTLMTIDIADYSDWDLDWALGPCAYGFFAWSQPAATFSNIKFSGLKNVENMYSVESGTLVEREDDGWVIRNKTAQEYYGWPNVIHNTVTDKRYMVLKDKVFPITLAELDERYSVEALKNS